MALPLSEFAYSDLAQAVPGTTIVLDHFGTPCGVGSYEGKMENVMSEWKADMVRMSEFENVVVKIGPCYAS